MLRPRAILCVDDLPMVHRLEETLLEPWTREGTRIVHAYDGIEALKSLATDSEVDLILLDINMPVMNGLAFLEHKQRTTFASVPAIVLSNEGDRPEEIAHALSLGAVRVLPKPFGFEDLESCVRELGTSPSP